MKDCSIVHDEQNVPPGMAHKIRGLSNKSKCVVSARTELEPIRGATASENEYIVDGDCIKMNGALDGQVIHSARRVSLWIEVSRVSLNYVRRSRSESRRVHKALQVAYMKHRCETKNCVLMGLDLASSEAPRIQSIFH